MEEHSHALQLTTLKEKLENELEQLPDDFDFQFLLQTLLVADTFIMEVEAKHLCKKKYFSKYLADKHKPKLIRRLQYQMITLRSD